MKETAPVDVKKKTSALNVGIPAAAAQDTPYKSMRSLSPEMRRTQARIQRSKSPISPLKESPDRRSSQPYERESPKGANMKNHHLSEISFYHDADDDRSDNSAITPTLKNTPFILIQGAFVMGKHKYQCEDAYFIQERAFGVSDGVSGWNDYGFSSDQFSLQLMSWS